MHFKFCVYCTCMHCFSVATGVTGQMLYWIMWEALCRLEEINLKVGFVVYLVPSVYMYNRDVKSHPTDFPW